MTDAEYNFIYKSALEEAEMYLMDNDPDGIVEDKDVEYIIKNCIQFFIDSEAEIEYDILYSDIKGDLDAILDSAETGEIPDF